MPNKFTIDNFEPRYLKKAKVTLEKDLHAVHIQNEINKGYQKEVSSSTLWQKFLNLFK